MVELKNLLGEGPDGGNFGEFCTLNNFNRAGIILKPF